MAGINIEKYHGSTEAKAVLRHCDKNKRLEETHANKQIDKSKSADNFQIGLKGYSKSYKGVCSEYDKRIIEVDSKATKAPRKDRVTLVGMELPRPEGLDPERFMDWSTDVLNTLCKFYGSDCLLVGYGHVDEVHEYMRFDETKQSTVSTMSREHLHVFLNPYSADRQSLNAKEFTSRKNLIELNKRVDEMTIAKYGVRFCDGSGKKSKKTVEQLKHESEALKQADISYLKAQIATLQAENDKLQAELDKQALQGELQAENDRLQEENDSLKSENNRLKAELRNQALKANRQTEREIPDIDYGSGYNGLSL